MENIKSYLITYLFMSGSVLNLLFAVWVNIILFDMFIQRLHRNGAIERIILTIRYILGKSKN